MSFLESYKGHCPYCGELIELVIDNSLDEQSYVEDCSVCCRPIVVEVRCSEGDTSVELLSEDE